MLLDILHQSLALLAYERSINELGSDFAGTRDSPADAEQSAYSLRSQVSNGRYRVQVIECNAEFTRCETGGSGAAAVRVDIEVFGRVFLDEVL